MPTPTRIVVIRCDDLSFPELDVVRPDGKDRFVNVKRTFPLRWDRHIVAGPLCDPNRASFLTGQRIWRHGLRANGWNLPDAENTLPAWLQAAGWTTAHVGKWMTSAPVQQFGWGPPGFSEWQTTQQSIYSGYVVNANGTPYTQTDYHTRYVTNRAVDALETISGPLFLLVDYTAPHLPATPEPKYAGTFDAWDYQHQSSYNEPDVSDKPPSMQRALLTPEARECLDQACSARRLDMHESTQAMEGRCAGALDGLAGELGAPLLVHVDGQTPQAHRHVTLPREHRLTADRARSH